MNEQGAERDDKTVLTIHDVAGELLDDWRMLFGTLQARFRTGGFNTGVELVRSIGAAADEMNHHPDVDLRFPHVDVRLTSHDVGGVTMRDVRLARTVSTLAGQAGASPDTSALQVVELALDTWDHDEIKPFWAALLGLKASDAVPDELTDPGGRWPTVWFQEAERHDKPPQRWHVDVRVPPEEAEPRVRRAVEAGGTLVSDERAPAFWVLADPQGNRACVCTSLDRDPA